MLVWSLSHVSSLRRLAALTAGPATGAIIPRGAGCPASSGPPPWCAAYSTRIHLITIRFCPSAQYPRKTNINIVVFSPFQVILFPWLSFLIINAMFCQKKITGAWNFGGKFVYTKNRDCVSARCPCRSKMMKTGFMYHNVEKMSHWKGSVSCGRSWIRSDRMCANISRFLLHFISPHRSPCPAWVAEPPDSLPFVLTVQPEGLCHDGNWFLPGINFFISICVTRIPCLLLFHIMCCNQLNSDITLDILRNSHPYEFKV